jgi:hypothetical protein
MVSGVKNHRTLSVNYGVVNLDTQDGTEIGESRYGWGSHYSITLVS